LTRHLLVIGGQRCGTTYLHALLDAHPDIAMARPARPEPKVFLSAEQSARGLEWYHQTFFGHAGDEAVLGEKSTSYIEHPEAADRAAAMLGAPLVLALLRDPVARAVSNWRFSAGHGLEERPLVRALSENLAGPRPWDPEQSSVSPFAYLERGRYADHLAPWLDRFPGSSSVHFFEDLTGDAAAVARLYDRLGVDSGFRPEAFGRPVNASEGVEPDLPESLVADLRDYFRDSDERLRRLLGRDLPWAAADTDHITDNTTEIR
jgi:hypothetical protein